MQIIVLISICSTQPERGGNVAAVGRYPGGGEGRPGAGGEGEGKPLMLTGRKAGRGPGRW